MSTGWHFGFRRPWWFPVFRTVNTRCVSSRTVRNDWSLARAWLYRDRVYLVNYSLGKQNVIQLKRSTSGGY